MQSGSLQVPRLPLGSTAGASESTREAIGALQRSMEFDAVLARCAEMRSHFSTAATLKVESIKMNADLTREAIKKAA